MRHQQQEAEWLISTLAATPSGQRSAPAPQAHHDTLTIMKLLEKEAKIASLDDELTRMKQTDTTQVHLFFKQVGFDEFIAWLEQVRSSTGLHPQKIKLDRIQQPGDITATAIF